MNHYIIFFPGPSIAKDLWIPNPLTQQLSFYNNVLTEVYGSSFEIMAPLQFKDYITSQRITRWKIEKDVTHLKQKVQNVLNSESKDGRAQNVARFSSEVMRTVRPGDSFKAESCKKVIQQMLDEVTVKLQEIVNLRSNLFDKNLIVKQRQANELKFLDSKKSSLEELKNTLQKTQEAIITNANLKRGEQIRQRNKMQRQKDRKGLQQKRTKISEGKGSEA